MSRSSGQLGRAANAIGLYRHHNQEEIDKRILADRCRVNIEKGTEIGPRMYENMKIIAARCVAERRGDG